jgi:hypothetical protein
MARVFVAEETRLGRRVVVKVLAPDLAQCEAVAPAERVALPALARPCTKAPARRRPVGGHPVRPAGAPVLPREESVKDDQPAEEQWLPELHVPTDDDSWRGGAHLRIPPTGLYGPEYRFWLKKQHDEEEQAARDIALRELLGPGYAVTDEYE